MPKTKKSKKNLRLFGQIFFDFLVFGMAKVKMTYFRQNVSKKFLNFLVT
jgi:hypothetical protein